MPERSKSRALMAGIPPILKPANLAEDVSAVGSLLGYYNIFIKNFSDN
jgi:hypothetical protein